MKCLCTMLASNRSAGCALLPPRAASSSASTTMPSAAECGLDELPDCGGAHPAGMSAPGSACAGMHVDLCHLASGQMLSQISYKALQTSYLGGVQSCCICAGAQRLCRLPRRKNLQTREPACKGEWRGSSPFKGTFAALASSTFCSSRFWYCSNRSIRCLKYGSFSFTLSASDLACAFGGAAPLAAAGEPFAGCASAT